MKSKYEVTYEDVILFQNKTMEVEAHTPEEAKEIVSESFPESRFGSKSNYRIKECRKVE